MKKNLLSFFLTLSMAGYSTSAQAVTLISDNFDLENGGVGTLNYTGFANWNVFDGSND